MSGFDPVHIVDVLARHRVEFVIIGGFAAELYEAPVPATQDIDVTPRVSRANMARLSAALDELGALVYTSGVPDGLPFAHDAASLAQVKVWNLICAAGRLDITFHPDGTAGTTILPAMPSPSTSPVTTSTSLRSRTSSAPRPQQGGPRTSPCCPPWSGGS